MPSRKFLIILVTVGYPFIVVAGIALTESGPFGFWVGTFIAAILAALLAIPGFVAARLEAPWRWGGLFGLAWAIAGTLLTVLALVGNSDYTTRDVINGAISTGVPMGVIGMGWLVGFAVYFRLGTARGTAARSDA